MKEGYWVIRTYISGSVGEKIKFWISGEKPSRSERKIKSDIRKLNQNYSSAEKELARLINQNFGKGDIFLGLDYSEKGHQKLLQRAALDEGELSDRIFKAAAHEASLCLRRVKRAAQAEGVEVKSIVTTSDMDGETGERVRVHHHLVINAEALPFFLAKWKLGGVHYEPLAAQEDYTPIANYLIRQVRHIENIKKYTPSRNLERPKSSDRIAKSGAEMRLPKNTKLLYRGQYIPYAPQYMRYYILPQDKEDDSGGNQKAKQSGGGRTDRVPEKQKKTGLPQSEGIVNSE